jgi:hypothetical protein
MSKSSCAGLVISPRQGTSLSASSRFCHQRFGRHHLRIVRARPTIMWEIRSIGAGLLHREIRYCRAVLTGQDAARSTQRRDEVTRYPIEKPEECMGGKNPNLCWSKKAIDGLVPLEYSPIGEGVLRGAAKLARMWSVRRPYESVNWIHRLVHQVVAHPRSLRITFSVAKRTKDLGTPR